MKQRDSNSGLTAWLFALGGPTMSVHLKRKPIRNGLYNREYMKNHSTTAPENNTIFKLNSNSTLIQLIP